jgi:hypothetical protein
MFVFASFYQFYGVVMVSAAQFTSPLADLFASPEVAAEGVEATRGSVVFAQGAPSFLVYFINKVLVRLFFFWYDV